MVVDYSEGFVGSRCGSSVEGKAALEWYPEMPMHTITTARTGRISSETSRLSIDGCLS